MQFGANINTLMQSVMAYRTPELLAVLPSIEAMEQEDRVSVVMRGKSSLDSVIKNWDKFSDVLAARGMTKSEVKKKGKDLKTVRNKLEMALRLKDPKIIPAPHRPKAESAFNVLVAWFEMNKGYMESVYAVPKLTRDNISELVLPPVAEEAPVDVIGRDEFAAGPDQARLESDGVAADVLDISGNSTVH